MDLSKAFDCLPHDILICKLSAYGLSDNATKLLLSYLSNRKQQIRIGNIVSTWANIQKGVPQGSIFGPLLFYAFINDIFYFIKHCDLYNYADNNTLSFHSPNFDEVVNVLQQESNILINWFHFNCMQTNPEKFQAIAVGKKSFDKSPIFQIGTANISCVDIDFMLNFDCHIKNICKKAVQQLNILKRIGKNLSKLNRLTIFHTFVLSNFIFPPCLGIFAQKLIRRKLKRYRKELYVLFTGIMRHLMKTY